MLEHLRPHELFMRSAWDPGRCFRCTSDERPVTPVIEFVWARITALESLCPPCLFRAWVTVEKPAHRDRSAVAPQLLRQITTLLADPDPQARPLRKALVSAMRYRP